jgi:hypothetical protein
MWRITERGASSLPLINKYFGNQTKQMQLCGSRIGEMGNPYRYIGLFGKPEGKSLPVRPNSKWQDAIKKIY